MVAEIITQIIYTLQKVWDNIIKPAFIELLADMNMILNIVMQALYQLLSKGLLYLSIWSLKVAQKCHKKSEKLIDKCWV